MQQSPASARRSSTSSSNRGRVFYRASEGRRILLLVLLLGIAACPPPPVPTTPTTTSTTSTMTTAPSTTTSEPPETVEWFTGPEAVPEGWTLEVQPNSAILNVLRDGELVGSVEMLDLPMESMTEFLSWLEEAQVDPCPEGETAPEPEVLSDALEVFVTRHLQSLEADRTAALEGYQFQPMEASEVSMGGVPGMKFGFTGFGPDGEFLERYIQYVTMDCQRLVLVTAAADPAAPGPFSRDDLAVFEPHLDILVERSAFPVQPPE